MYTKRLQLVNYGPIEKCDIELPFAGETPKPIVLVGENGSGKSILLSHIVNGLVMAKGVAFPDSQEVETGKVYKIRSGEYILHGREYYFTRVDYAGGLFTTEMRLRREKQQYSEIPIGQSNKLAQELWAEMDSNAHDHYKSNIKSSTFGAVKLPTPPGAEATIEKMFSTSCVLYFPFNRFEEPAWLNQANLAAQAQHTESKRMAGSTNRKVIALSPLQDNQNWLFDVIYDRAAFEIQTRNFPINVPVGDSTQSVPLPLFLGYSGNSNAMYEAAQRVVRILMGKENARFGIGPRNNRVVSLESDPLTIVPNIFQLSSGETSLLNLFLSILRDFDSCGTPFSGTEEIRGIVVVDEIDLHLHAVHQHEVLPELIKMFPNVQFVVTTHSPLFVLGMQRVFGEDGFALYRLPQGQLISPEEFSEFGAAYKAFVATRTFNEDMNAAIANALKPIVFVEGNTDQRYIEKASTLLGKEMVLESLEIRDGGGSGKLTKMWKDSVLPLTEAFPHKVLLLFDCDTNKQNANKGKLFQRCIPMQDQNPIKKGIENLFSKSTLKMARQQNSAFFITEEEHGGTDENGNPITIPEKWEVNDSEKTNLCDWLCENGVEEDFKHFQLIFDLIEEALGLTSPQATASEAEAIT